MREQLTFDIGCYSQKQDINLGKANSAIEQFVFYLPPSLLTDTWPKI